MWYIASFIVLAVISPALAEVSVIQSPSGATGMITGVGGGVGIYRDAHGTTAVVQDSSGVLRSTQPNTPSGTPSMPLSIGPAAVQQQEPMSPLTSDEAVRAFSPRLQPPTGIEKRR